MCLRKSKKFFVYSIGYLIAVSPKFSGTQWQYHLDVKIKWAATVANKIRCGLIRNKIKKVLYRMEQPNERYYHVCFIKIYLWWHVITKKPHKRDLETDFFISRKKTFFSWEMESGTRAKNTEKKKTKKK